MRGLKGRARGLVPALLQACWLASASTPLPLASEDGADQGPWPRVRMRIAGSAVRQALDGASRRLEGARCQAVFSDFSDRNGRPLDRKLVARGMTGPAYLTLLFFYDGSGRRQCRDERTLAFTAPGSGVVFVCGLQFERAWKASASFAEALLIHEALHTLGLGENPPSSDAITQHVVSRCGR